MIINDVTVFVLSLRVSVMYFSVHRYEDGSFWPHLKESASGFVGAGAGQGYNIILPWNKVNNTKWCKMLHYMVSFLYIKGI